MEVLVATADGLVRIDADGAATTELARPVNALARRSGRRWLAVVDGHALWGRDATGAWRELASTDTRLTAVTGLADDVFAGTADTRVVQLDGGHLRALPGFDELPGREKWHAVGSRTPYVRSMTATAEGTILANVHVGGIARSTDGGATWFPTIDVDHDVHEVRAHGELDGVVTAAAAVGLCVSHDGGSAWDVIDDGFHATYARAVALLDDHVLISASEGPFARRCAVYQRPVSGAGPVARVRDGLPEWLPGIVDTGCLAAADSVAALADGDGDVWVSRDLWHAWTCVARGLPEVRAVALVDDRRGS